jgi:ATP-dependent DNA helicase PIF1
LRNINQPQLCNGTRLAVKKLMSNVVEATILTGPFKGEDVLISRIPMIPTDMPFQFKRLQFPFRVAFAITINKAQGQPFEVCGLDLHTDCFSHGQLYVACSKVGKLDNLYIYTANGTTKKYCIPTGIGKLNIFETWASSLFLLFHVTGLSHSNAWPGTASMLINWKKRGYELHIKLQKKYNTSVITLPVFIACLQGTSLHS